MASEETKAVNTVVGSDEFIATGKELVADYTNGHLDATDNASITPDQVYVVWYAKELGNHKGLFSTPLLDGMYYEITFNGATNEFYFDAYKKWDNIVFNDIIKK